MLLQISVLVGQHIRTIFETIDFVSGRKNGLKLKFLKFYLDPLETSCVGLDRACIYYLFSFIIQYIYIFLTKFYLFKPIATKGLASRTDDDDIIFVLVL